VLPAFRRASTGFSDEDIQATENFLAIGRDLQAQLAAVIHRELDARAVDRRALARWHRACLAPPGE
jgi:hypothetical protein